MEAAKQFQGKNAIVIIYGNRVDTNIFGTRILQLRSGDGLDGWYFNSSINSALSTVFF
jgi:hypothetical protein